MPDTPDLAALIGSRICHDLISPIGAISNGVELLMMDGSVKTAEMALIAESVAQANARIRFFRIAFGAADMRDQRVARAEVQSILADQTRGGRLHLSWTSPSELPRIEVKLAFLLLLCLENALPYGGQIAVSCEDGGWRIVATAERMKHDPDLWALVGAASDGADISPARVQFVLITPVLERTGRVLTKAVTPGSITLTF